MSWLVRWPAGFVPEEHGWVRAADGVGLAVWLRWAVPYRFPAAISKCLHDAASGAVGGWYEGPIEGEFPEMATLGQIHREMTRCTHLSEDRTDVSVP